ncbi:hypothetical protein Plim_1223 [Planctopirus limnophila DSM 3776]|uniref:Uncharacterized protein n=1 Tax=Planctopirus limnophila (strain ATCC 43296 / DSM 3776 / IFAM 1008 / Mu 290) TaxID=521674 RepID=D5SUK6_PLAL2|nr:hypothetical protein [Planctopirus limnophila]ADG67058.1 hypothetical protein Plim_1223 [Planctopirus limnophila DSM 3776]
MSKSLIRAPSLRQLPPPAEIRRDLGAITREAAFLRSMLKLSERLHRHLELIQTLQSIQGDSKHVQCNRSQPSR